MRLEKLAAKGIRVKSLEKRPEISPGLEEYMEIYTTLHRTRQVGMGPCPLRMADIVAALDFYEIDNLEERHEALGYILALDETWLTWAQDRNK